MSIQWPEKRAVSDRKYHEAAVRGRFENNLRILRGTLNIQNPPIVVAGRGFTATWFAPGDATVTFDPKFSQAPTVTGTGQRNDTLNRHEITIIGAPTVSTVRIFRTQGGVGQDGIVHFLVIGPA